MSDDLFVVFFIVFTGLIALGALIFVWRLEHGSNNTPDNTTESNSGNNS